MLEYWNTGIMGFEETGLWNIDEFLLTAKLINEYLSFHINIPIFPGPDLIGRTCVPWAPLRKYYSEQEVFHASRARAGHYSMYKALASSLKKSLYFY